MSHKNQEQEEEKHNLVAQLIKLKGEVPVAGVKLKSPTTPKTISSLSKVNFKPLMITLKKRGLKGFSTKAVGAMVTQKQPNLPMKKSIPCMMNI